MVDTFLPEGAPSSVHASHAPAAEDLPRLVDSAVASKDSSIPPPELLKTYQSLVGALLHCFTQTRPDVAYAVGLLCRAMSCLTPSLLDAAYRVLAYLRHHQHVGLRYELCSHNVRGHSDSDWAVRHSTTGWASVALSSCEAEIVAASEAAKKAVYLRALFSELGLPQSEPTPLSMDNKSAIDLAYTPEHHQRTKHIDRRHFFVREKVETHDITVPFVTSADNMADFFTKPLPPRIQSPFSSVCCIVVFISFLLLSFARTHALATRATATAVALSAGPSPWPLFSRVESAIDLDSTHSAVRKTLRRALTRDIHVLSRRGELRRGAGGLVKNSARLSALETKGTLRS
eukprot:1658599-Pleurochrysis_carterae.AAC.2